jgi:hypothetical protein
MTFVLLLLQAATLGLVVYVLLQLQNLFREVRTPVVRQKGQLPADFRDRLRTMPRPSGEAPKSGSEAPSDNREGRNRDDRGPREGRDRDRNRDDRGPREGRDRDRNRDDRGPREGRDRDRNRDDRGPREGRDRDRNRDDRGPRPPRTENAPVAETSPAPAADVAESAPAAAPVATPAAAPSFGGRRPLGPVSSSAGAAAVESSSSSDALAPSSMAQPVAENPIRHGRRALPKPKPRFDDEPDTETPAA